MTIADLQLGTTARITRIRNDSATILRLMELGLVAGAPIQVKQRAPFGGPIRVQVSSSALCLRSADARCFEVETGP